jgi:predicted RNA binding protein YcfA (HicA-like mRNA interferase family)
MSYQRRKVMAALERCGVTVLREGGMHAVVQGPVGRQSSVPRHTAINRILFRKIAKQLGLDPRTLEREVK